MAKVKKTEMSEKDAILAEVSALVEKYNESAEFAEYKTMKKLDADIAEKVGKYNELSENECFEVLKVAENPMLAAAKKLRFSTIKVRDEKREEGGTVRVVDPSASRPIDPLRLHKRTNDGIGANTSWHVMVERLNFVLTNKSALELEASLVSAKEYKMSEAAREYDGFETPEDPAKAKKNSISKDIQAVVDAMIGEGYTVTPRMVNYLLKTYIRKDSRASLSVTAANHTALRRTMLEVCHMAAFGGDIVVNCKRESK